MTRICACIVLMLTSMPSLDAQESLERDLVQRYGEGVHAFYSRNYNRAHQILSDAINSGSQDPRAYYFRGLAAMRMGRSYEGEADLQFGAMLEAQGSGGKMSVNQSLRRIQGRDRLKIEQMRRDARYEAARQQRALAGVRQQEEQARQAIVLRPTVPADVNELLDGSTAGSSVVTGSPIVIADDGSAAMPTTAPSTLPNPPEDGSAAATAIAAAGTGSESTPSSEGIATTQPAIEPTTVDGGGGIVQPAETSIASDADPFAPRPEVTTDGSSNTEGAAPQAVEPEVAGNDPFAADDRTDSVLVEEPLEPTTDETASTETIEPSDVAETDVATDTIDEAASSVPDADDADIQVGTKVKASDLVGILGGIIENTFGGVGDAVGGAVEGMAPPGGMQVPGIGGGSSGPTVVAPADSSAGADPFGADGEPGAEAVGSDPFGGTPAGDDPFGGEEMDQADAADPFGGSDASGAASDDPFGTSDDSETATDDPFGTGDAEAVDTSGSSDAGSDDAALESDDPFGSTDSGADDTGSASDDPFGAGDAESADTSGSGDAGSEDADSESDDPFGSAESGSDEADSASDDPFAADDSGADDTGSSDSANNPFGSDDTDSDTDTDDPFSSSDGEQDADAASDESDDPFAADEDSSDSSDDPFAN